MTHGSTVTDEKVMGSYEEEVMGIYEEVMGTFQSSHTHTQSQNK